MERYLNTKVVYSTDYYAISFLFANVWACSQWIVIIVYISPKYIFLTKCRFKEF